MAPKFQQMDRTEDPHIPKVMPLKVLKRPGVPSEPGPRSTKKINPRKAGTL
jgi:hypothetical protein